MNKICIFVEGNSEAILVDRIASHLLNGADARIVSFLLSGGRRYPRMEMQRTEKVLGHGNGIYIQIVNSSNEDRAISDAKDQAQSLRDANFDRIIVLRDVAPNFARSEISKLREGLETTLATLPLPADALLQVMEFEAWLLSMADQFWMIDDRMSVEAITHELGFLPDCTNCQAIDRPSETHERILGLAGIEDAKSRNTTVRVVDSIDLALLLGERSPHIPDLHRLAELVGEVAA